MTAEDMDKVVAILLGIIAAFPNAKGAKTASDSEKLQIAMTTSKSFENTLSAFGYEIVKRV